MSLRDRLRRPPIGVIAEIKRRSPSAGAIDVDLDPVELARSYVGAGATAISVLTEPDHFGGSLDDLRAVREAVQLPLLRKDFIVDLRQIEESRQNGADAVLIIVAVVGQSLPRMLERCRDAGIEALVEVHDDSELSIALDAGAQLIGINNRDLNSFEIDLTTSARLRPSIPPEVTVVAESGIHQREQIERYVQLEFDACLIGSALVSSADPAERLRQLLGRVA